MEFFIFMGALSSIANLCILIVLIKETEQKLKYFNEIIGEFAQFAAATEEKFEPLLSSSKAK